MFGKTKVLCCEKGKNIGVYNTWDECKTSKWILRS